MKQAILLECNILEQVCDILFLSDCNKNGRIYILFEYTQKVRKTEVFIWE